MSENDLGPPLVISFRLSYAGLLFSLLACWTLCGCGRPKDPRITPAETARQSLGAALAAWQDGQAAGKIETTSLPIQVVDSVWLKGRKLDSYEILSEEPDEDGLRWYSVRLNLQGPKASEVVRYLVIGRSPVFVYREADYMQSRSWKGMK
jgi:hypothetical protein